MNKFGWFFTGIFVCGIILDIGFSYYNLGSINQRVAVLVLGILGIGFNIVFLKDKKPSSSSGVSK